MKGILKYIQPDPEINYNGDWIVQLGNGIESKVFKLTDESMNWISKNDPISPLEVEFEKIPICTPDLHQVLAHLNFVEREKIYKLSDLERAFNSARETSDDFKTWISKNK